MTVLGRNIVAEFFGCPSELLNDVSLIESKMIAAARAAHATVISATFHHFSPFGVSGVVVIQESHLAIHTWPEYGYAALDVFTCGDAVDPWDVYKFIYAELKVENGSAIELGRGQKKLLHWRPLDGTARRAPKNSDVALPAPVRNVWFTELDTDVALSLRHAGEPLLRAQSPHQKIEIFETIAYGRALVLDGMLMTTERDEHVYHEMVVHPALLTHNSPRRILIIGGGDGGVARELCRHECVEEVTVVEIDELVVKACQRHLPTLSRGLSHPRVKLQIADGVKFASACSDNRYDVVIVDSTDPVGPAKGLFSRDFYRHARRILDDDGVLVAPAESPWHNARLFAEIFACHADTFGREHVFPYLITVPTYPSGLWSLLYSSKGRAHPLVGYDSARAAGFTATHALRSYSADMHRAAFALPGYVKSLLASV